MGYKMSTEITSNHQLLIPNFVCSNIGFLRALSRTKSERKKKQILKRATTDQLLAIIEICLNVVKNRYVRLTKRQRSRLLPYVDAVRRLSRVRSEQGARRILLQKGDGFGGGPGFYAALLTPIIIEIAKLFTKKS